VIGPGDQHRGEIDAEINLSAGDPLRRVAARRQAHVPDIGKAFLAPQLFGNLLRSDADPAEIGYAYRGCFESVLRG